MDPTASGRFLDYMKGVGDSLAEGVTEGAKGVYDFGQVAVGGTKALTKEGLNAVGATDLASGIEINDIEPVSSLGKIAAQGGYAGLGDAVKSMPANVANGITDAAAAGDMRALGSAVTNAVFATEGARAGTAGIAKGAAKGASKILSPKTVEASAAAAVSNAPVTAPKSEVPSVAKAQAANAAAKQSGAQPISNKAAGRCDKERNADGNDGVRRSPPPKPPKYRNLKPMHKKYASEETGAVWGTKVKYLTAAERQKYRLQIKNGKFYDSSGKLFDTKKADTLFNKGRAIFVMDESGSIYASTKHQRGFFHHSSFLSGEPVASAGEIVVNKGVLSSVSRKSGHYMPDAEHLNQFISEIEGSGVNISSINILQGLN